MKVQVEKDCKILSLSGTDNGKEDNGGAILKEDYNHIRTLKALRIIILRKIKIHFIALYPKYKIFKNDNSIVYIEDANDEEMILCLKQWNSNITPLDNSYSLSFKELTFFMAIEILEPILKKVDQWFLDEKKTWTGFLSVLNSTSLDEELMEQINNEVMIRYFDQKKVQQIVNTNDDNSMISFLQGWGPNVCQMKVTEEQFNEMYEENNNSIHQLKLEQQKYNEQSKVVNEMKESNIQLQDMNKKMEETVKISLEQQQQLQQENKISSDRLILEEASLRDQKIQLNNLTLEMEQLKEQMQLQNSNQQEILKDQNQSLNELKDKIIELNKENQLLNQKIIEDKRQYTSYMSSISTPSLHSSLSPSKRKQTENKINYRLSLFEHFSFPSSMFFTGQLQYQNLLFVTEELNFDDTTDSFFKCLSIKLLGSSNNYSILKTAFMEFSNIIEEEYKISETDVTTIVNNFNTIFKSFLSTHEKHHNIQIWEYSEVSSLNCYRNSNGFSCNEKCNIYLLYFYDPINNDLKFRIVNPLHIYYEN